MSDTVSRFDGLASDYAKYRPSYPGEVFDDILYGFGARDRVRVVDVGAGTGISTALLRDRGVNVVGIEPNSDMRAIAVAQGLDVRDAPAHELPFADAGVDVITAFQSFHWFANAAAVAEFSRVLVPRGRIAIIWNERDDDDAFTRAYGDAVDSFAKRMVAQEFKSVAPTASEIFGDLFAKPNWYLRSGMFPHVQRFDRAAMHGRARSTSYAPRGGDGYRDMVAALDRIFETFRNPDGIVEMKMLAQVFVLDRSGAS